MTEQERIDLLKRVAACAPKELNARLYNEDAVRFESVMGDWQDVTLDAQGGDIDRYDAAGIIVMLDAMVEADWVQAVVLVTPSEQFGGKYRVVVRSRETTTHLMGFSDRGYQASVPVRSEIGLGNTRAEAVARAFVEVFKVSTPSTPNNQENQEDDNGKD